MKEVDLLSYYVGKSSVYVMEVFALSTEEAHSLVMEILPMDNYSLLQDDLNASIKRGGLNEVFMLSCLSCSFN